MSEISKITLPSGTTYDLKDEKARELIAALDNFTGYLGVTTTVLSDGATTNPIAIGTESVTAKSGDIATYGKKEFIFSGLGTWAEFGDLSDLGTLAYKNKAEGIVIAAGNVSTPTFSGSDVSYTPAGSVAVDAIVPKGTVTAPTITVTPTTASITGMSDAGSLPSCTLPSMTATVSNETLTLGWTAGSFSAGKLPTKATAQTVMTGASASASAPTFSGTSVTPNATFSGTKTNIKAAGTVSKPTFTGTSVSVEVS